MTPRSLMLGALGVLTLAFLAVPILIIVPMSFSSAQALAFPPPGFSLRWYGALFGDPRWLQALATSFALALVSSLLALVLGGLAAYGLHRSRLRARARTAAEVGFMAPAIVPTIIVAVALYVSLARIGLLGSALGLVLAHTILNVPFCVLLLGVALRGLDVRLERVAWTLGASWSLTMRRVVLPNIMPAVAAAWIFAFIGSFDEVVVTTFIAGTYETVPKRMFNELVLQINPVITAVATLLIGVTAAGLALVALLLRRTQGRPALLPVGG